VIEGKVKYFLEVTVTVIIGKELENRCLVVYSCEVELSESTVTKSLLVVIQKAILILILFLI